MDALGVRDLAPAAAALGIVLVAQDRHQPGVQVGARPVLVAIGDRLGQRLLHQVVRPVAVAAERAGEAAQHRDRGHQVLAKGIAHEPLSFSGFSSSLARSSSMSGGIVLLQRLVVDPAQLVGDPVLLAHAPAAGASPPPVESLPVITTPTASTWLALPTVHRTCPKCAKPAHWFHAHGTFPRLGDLSDLRDRGAVPAGRCAVPEDQAQDAHQPFTGNRSPPALPAPLRAGADRLADQRRRARDRLPRGDPGRSGDLRPRRAGSRSGSTGSSTACCTGSRSSRPDGRRRSAGERTAQRAAGRHAAGEPAGAAAHHARGLPPGRGGGHHRPQRGGGPRRSSPRRSPRSTGRSPPGC